MLNDAKIATRLPAQDLERAETFYREKLGLIPADRRTGGLLYVFPGGDFELYESGGTSPGTFTQMGWLVEDIATVVDQLRDRGVKFEEYDVPGLRTSDGIAPTDSGYPLQGSQAGELGAWFKDSEGNILGLVQVR